MEGNQASQPPYLPAQEVDGAEQAHLDAVETQKRQDQGHQSGSRPPGQAPQPQGQPVEALIVDEDDQRRDESGHPAHGHLAHKRIGQETLHGESGSRGLVPLGSRRRAIQRRSWARLAEPSPTP